MRNIYCIGVWMPSLSEASKFVSDHLLAADVIQFVPDTKGAFWIMLRVTADQHKAIMESPDTSRVI